VRTAKKDRNHILVYRLLLTPGSANNKKSVKSM